MAIKEIGRGKSLKYTPVGGSQVTIDDIQSYDYSRGAELLDSKVGTGRVPTRYRGNLDATIQIETRDIAAAIALKKGDKATAVTLDVEAAIESHGTAAGGGFRVVLSHAVVSEIGNISHGSEGDDPATVAITFQIDRHGGANEPTITESEITGS